MSKETFSYPKVARLLTKSDFQRVFDKFEKAGDRYFVVFGSANGIESARLGLAISRKCAIRAVDRNRIKRLVRETFRASRKDLSGIDFVVLCRSSVVSTSNSLLLISLSRLFKKVRFRLCGLS